LKSVIGVILGFSGIAPIFLWISHHITFGYTGMTVESNSLDSQERLANILIRLEAIRQEQSQLLEEVSAILAK